MFAKILLASDGSSHAEKAAQEAVKLIQSGQPSEITVLYVVDSSTSKADVLAEGSKEVLLQKRKQRLESTEKILKDKAVPYTIQVIKGEPCPAIVEYANKHGFDIVVIGSRGLNSLQEMVLGSVSHKVAKRANCPVMIVK